VGLLFELKLGSKTLNVQGWVDEWQAKVEQETKFGEGMSQDKDIGLKYIRKIY
jgi:hypothetical protein